MTSTTDLRDPIAIPSPEALEWLIYLVGSARGGTKRARKVIDLHGNVLSFDGLTHFLNQPCARPPGSAEWF